MHVKENNNQEFLIDNYYYFNRLPIVLAACCFRGDGDDDDDDDDELLFIVLLLLFAVSRLVAFCLMDERSIAEAICFDVILTKDTTKINESAKAVKTIFLFIFIQS
jgi:hypothetical protein